MKPKLIWVHLSDGLTCTSKFLHLIVDSVREAEQYCRDNYGAYDIVALTVAQTTLIGVGYNIEPLGCITPESVHNQDMESVDDQ